MGQFERADFDQQVQWLAVPHRAKDAFWHLIWSGPAALAAVRRGLASDDVGVRNGCARVLDHLVDEESYPELIALLSDSSSAVRFNALHALACDKCKDNACRPPKQDILDQALALLRRDSSKYVRAMAVEIVGRFVHEDPAAHAALIAARDSDPQSSVRKKASWFCPGGPIYERTKPRPQRVTR